MEETTKRAGPALVWANWFRFHPAQTIRHARVDSVCFIWTIQGTGRIRSRGREFALEPGWILRLPWGHDVQYRASDRQPFHLGTLHLVPRHDLSTPIEFVVAHDARPQLFDSPHRRDTDAGTTAVLVPATSTIGREFVMLGTYAVERFMAGPMDEQTCRALGVLVEAESSRFTDEARNVSWPPSMQAMAEFIGRELARPLSVTEIATAGGCSPTTAQRLFAEHTGKSVIGWVRSARMAEAARLLRTTGMRVSEVARATGFTDALYFSRSFRLTFGVPPSKFLNEQLRP